MKKMRSVLVRVLLFLIFVSLAGICHHEHVHGLDAGDECGTCPECDGTLFVVEMDYPTCTESGTAYANCDTCSYNTRISVPATGHSYVSKPRRQPTCTEEGTMYYTCENCTSSYTETIPALGHNYVATDSIEATCTEKGTIHYACSRCNESYDEEIAALGHNYKSSVTKQPTCTASGTRTYTCSRCSDSYTESIAATGHSYKSSVTKKATCKEAGVKTYTCSNCNSSYTESIAALGHDYKSSATKKATCTEAGETTYTCTRCSDSYGEAVPALGHDYKSSVTKKATCTEEGTRTYTCSRCSDSYKEKIKALGHDMEYEEVEATCTEEGIKTGTCKRCHEKTEEKTPALGHDPGDYVVIRKATCDEEGLEEAVCRRCEEKIQRKIPKLEHEYPEEWTTEKKATYFEEGSEFKLCGHCGGKIEQIIPKKDIMPVAAGGAGVAAVLGCLFFFMFRRLKKPGRKLLEKTAKEALKPEFEDRTVAVCSSEEKLIKKLKAQKHLVVKACAYEEAEDTIKENEADLLITEINDEERLNEVLEKKRSEEENTYSLGLTLDKKVLEDKKEELEQLKKDKEITGYVEIGSDPNVALVKLVLPIMKPKLNSDEQLANIGMIADALGIPGISTVINVYVSGRDIKATLEEGELGTSEKATIIADIASILGLDTIESVAGLVSDVDSIKEAFDEEAGANQRAAGIDGVKDIIDVVSDLADK